MENIVKVKTSDNQILHGLLTTPSQLTDRVLINIHGTASNFYIEDFLPVIASELEKSAVATLATNNRGANALKGWEMGGACEEIFEECLLDIDAWIEFAVARGFKIIYLSGHSLGSEKVVYYMDRGQHKYKVTKVVLLGPSDSFGYEETSYGEKLHDLLQEAQSLVDQGKPEVFLTGEWICHGKVLPQSAKSFLNFFSPNSELSKTLPLRHNDKLVMYSNIKSPILVAISDNENDEYTVIPTNDALQLLKQNNPVTQAVQITRTDHCFTGKESELAKIVAKFLQS